MNAKSQSRGAAQERALAEVRASRSALAEDNAQAALTHGRRAYELARSNRGHQLLSVAWLSFVDALEVVEPSGDEYREHVQGLFEWAETMPEEIQFWLFPALEPHLDRLDLRYLRQRAIKRRAAAEKWLERGNMNVLTRLQSFHLEDVTAGRDVDPRILAHERHAAFYIDELFDPEGKMLREVAQEWDRVGRRDRAEFVRAVAEELQSRSGESGRSHG